MEPENEMPDNQLNIELSEDIAEGIYSNLAIISHSNAEFIIDFIRLLPGVPKAKVKSRIIMTPQHMKRLQMAISDNLLKYEYAYGKIELKDGDNPMGGINFGGPSALA